MNTYSDSFGSSVILSSIPLNRSFKSFLIKKFVHLNTHNGAFYASELFKGFKELVMEYCADPQRKARMEYYYSALQIRNRSVKRRFFVYADTMPHALLDLLKIYTSYEEPLVTEEESSKALQASLSKLSGSESLQDQMRSFLESRDRHEELHLLPSVMKTLNSRMNSVLESIGKTDSMSISWPTPSAYSSNDQFFSDMDEFLMTCSTLGIDLDDLLSNEPDILQWNSHYKSWPNRLIRPVGRIHHIPKKGTIKRRPIANPNKFWQALSEPYSRQLYALLRTYKTDATFNQNRFTSEIKDRIDKGLYVGSVDLSSATDNLPLSWFPLYSFVPKLVETNIGRSVVASMLLARLDYRDGDHILNWKQGQPLGSLPSFAILGITHNTILWCLSKLLQLKDLPYRIVGDDLIVYNEELRALYIEFMTFCGIPLSLHKSYENRAVEFVGRFFVKNQNPNFISDHTPVYWNNLFDYQQSTGVEIPWDRLPLSLQRQWATGFENLDKARKSYRFVSAIAAKNHVLNEQFTVKWYEVLASSIDTKADDVIGETVLYLYSTFRIVNSIKPMKVPKLREWKKLKFRPFTTTTLRNAAIVAIGEVE